MKRPLFVATVITLAGISAFTPISERTAPVKQYDFISSNQTTKWTLDKAHSSVLFSVSHLVISDVQGSFRNFDGSVEASKPDFSDAKISFTVEVGSINTDNENRDTHLKSDDFFNAAKFPQIKFVSNSFQPLGNNKYKLTGDLTIRDVTKPVSFDVTYGGTSNAFGGVFAGFKAKTTINRLDYNLKWDKTTEAGGLVVGHDVDVTLNVALKKA